MPLEELKLTTKTIVLLWEIVADGIRPHWFIPGRKRLMKSKPLPELDALGCL